MEKQPQHVPAGKGQGGSQLREDRNPVGCRPQHIPSCSELLAELG